MNRFYLNKLVLLIAILSGSSLGALAQIVTFNYTGAVQSWVVPAGVTSVSVDARGAVGGKEYNGYGDGGKGGRIQAQMAVTPGTTLYIYVGGKGGDGPTCCTYGAPAGYNGGGASQYYYAGSGGGATDIRVGGTALTNRTLVAGGGGGGGYNCGGGGTAQFGGDGGGTTGGNGNYCSSYSSCNSGNGGTPTAGGTPPGCYTGYSGIAGSLGQGGSVYLYGAGGGGGGYYGGSAGAYAGGGGGSSYTAPTIFSSITHTQGFNTLTSGTLGNGSITITGPTLSTSISSIAFGALTVGTTASRTFTISGVNLTGGAVNVAAPIGYQVSTDGTTYTTSVSASYTGSTLTTTTIYVRFAPTSFASYTGNVVVSGGGAPFAANVAVSGSGLPACTGTPTAGTAAISPTSGGGSTTFDLTLSGSTSAGGITFQWQRSLYAGGGYTNISGANTASYSFTGLTGNFYYRAAVSCGTNTAYSNAVLATVDPAPSSCTPTCTYASSLCSNNMMLATSGNPLTMTGDYGTELRDATNCSSTAYNNNVATHSVTLSMGGTYNMRLGNNINGYTMSSQIWIDFNNNGSFETGETVGGATWTGSSRTQAIDIPSTGISSGSFRMRVMNYYASSSGTGYSDRFPSLPPCPTTSGVGQTAYMEARDYTVNIVPAPCTGTPAPGTVSADITDACSAFTSTLLSSGGPTSYGIAYTWQSSTVSSTTGFTNISGATNPYLTRSVSGTTWYRLNVTCTNSSLSATTPAIRLALNAPPAALTGCSNVCTGEPCPMTSLTTGGTWSSSSTSVAAVGLTTGVVAGVSPGTTVITYTIPSGCIGTKTVSVSNSPSPISGSTNVCEGSTTSLGNTYTGGAWSSSNTARATVGTSSGVVSGVSAGSSNITYTLPSGCTSVAPVTINGLPAAITGATDVCIGSNIVLSSASTGGTWRSSNSFQASADATSGSITGVSVGTPLISYTLPTGCVTIAPINVLELPEAITGTMNTCVGTTSMLMHTVTGGTWASSNTSLASIDATTGEVTGVNSGSVTITYTVPAGCKVTAPFTINALPDAAYSVTGGGDYCPSGSGRRVGLSGSATGILYELYKDGIATGISTGGTSAGIDFGVFMDPAVYTVKGTNDATGCAADMTGSVTIGLSTPPAAFNVTPSAANYCPGTAGAEIGLDNSETGVSYRLFRGTTPVGTLVPGSGSSVSFGTQTAGTYTVRAVGVTSGCTSDMNGFADVYLSAAPAVHAISGGGPYCQGTGGVAIGISPSDAGVNYNLYRGTDLVQVVSGSGGAVDFPTMVTEEGTYTASAYDITSRCISMMTGTAVVNMNENPAVYTVAGGGSYCDGGTGRHIGTAFSVSGINYELYNGTTLVNTVAGANASLDFGLVTDAGTYTVRAVNAATMCSSNMTGSATIIVNTNPGNYNVSAGSTFCAGGTGVMVSLDGTDADIAYQLYRNGVPTGAVRTGTGGALDFGMQTAAGNYTITGRNASTLCSTEMTGISTVNVNPLPMQYNVTGGGAYCSGTTGVDVMMNPTSTPGVDYHLYNAGVLVATIAGTGGALNFGPQTAAGVYTIVAETGAGCTRDMSGSANVAVNALPAAYAVTVTNGGNYCEGTSGVHVGLALSASGINYDLQRDGTTVTTLSGTGGILDFGVVATEGNYTVVARNATTSCSRNMTGSATVTRNALPVMFTTTGGGSYCEGGTGAVVSLSGSVVGNTYQLYNGTSMVGAVLPGDGAGISFPAVATTGTYRIVGISAAGCSRSMIGSVAVDVNPAPVAFTVTGGGSICSEGAGAHINLSGSSLGGYNYTVYNGTTIVGTPWAGTGLALDLGAYTEAGTYTVKATNAGTGCASDMIGTAEITVTPSVLPTVAISTGTAQLCAATPATLTATSTNGGISPAYSWKVNGATVGLGSSYTYVPVTGDIVTATLTSGAACASPAIVSAVMTMTVTPRVVPAANVTATSTTICPGTSVTFTATSVNGGATPMYSWKKNGLTVGSGSTYAYAPNDSDVVFAVLTSNAECRTSNLAISNNIVIDVNAPTLPEVTLTANPGTNIGGNQSVTFTASATNAGASPTYAWKVNGTYNTVTTPTFTTNTLNNNDVVTSVVTNTNACGSLSASKSMLMRVAVGVDQVNAIADVKVMPNPNKGTFTVAGSVAAGTDEVALEVTNMAGQVVYRSNAKVVNGVISEQVQLGGTLANGMYLLNVRTGAENKVFHFVVGQ